MLEYLGFMKYGSRNRATERPLKNYERVEKTREWMIGIDMKTAESLILKQYDKFK